MSLNRNDSINLASNIKSIDLKSYINLEVAPTSLYISDIINVLKDSNVNVIGQNFDYRSFGSYTGGVCLDQMRELGINKTILGHSERRSKFNETDNSVNEKLETILNTDFNVIFCFDSYEQIPFDIIKDNIKVNSNYKLTLAYEPTWAIGTGKTASIDHIIDVHTKVKDTLNKIHLINTPILYGGSVNPGNSNGILNADNVDGVLVGGASTNYDQLKGIVNSI